MSIPWGSQKEGQLQGIKLSAAFGHVTDRLT